jgi:uncharacterized protein (DUF433 family)
MHKALDSGGLVMTHHEKSFIGVGIYTVTEASRLVGVPARTIRRWATGYTYSNSGAVRRSPPLWTAELPKIDGSIALGFRDLIEVRVVQALLDNKISWRRIRRIGAASSKLLETDHPFSTARFRTCGHRIYLDLPKASGDSALIEPEGFQLAMAKIIEPFLSDIDYGERGEAARWWPLGKRNKGVVVDPNRAFGRPIVDSAGVPTAALYAAYNAEDKDAETVARWYRISRGEVEKAVEFEERLAA